MLNAVSSRTIRARVWRGVTEEGAGPRSVTQHRDILDALIARIRNERARRRWSTSPRPKRGSARRCRIGNRRPTHRSTVRRCRATGLAGRAPDDRSHRRPSAFLGHRERPISVAHPPEGPVYRTFTPRRRWSPSSRSRASTARSSSRRSTVSRRRTRCSRWPTATRSSGRSSARFPLTDIAAAEAALEARPHPALRGIRHQIHHEADPDWLLRRDVEPGLALLARRGLAFDVVAVFPHHLGLVPVIADRHPDLTLVIDHLAKPPFRRARVGYLVGAASCGGRPAQRGRQDLRSRHGGRRRLERRGGPSGRRGRDRCLRTVAVAVRD